MSYNNLSGIKMINGVPADLNAFNKVIENDIFFKTQVDTDEDMAALDRDIIPLQDDTFSFGSLTKFFKNLFISSIVAKHLAFNDPSLTDTVINFGSEVNGFVRTAPNRLAYKTGTYYPLSLGSDVIKMTTANSSQLQLESVEPTKEASWFVGGNKDEFGITYVDSGPVKLFSISPTILTSYNPVHSVSGSAISPAFSFLDDAQSGLYRDGLTLGLATAGIKRLEVGANGIKTSKVLSPGYFFTNSANTSITLDEEDNNINFNVNENKTAEVNAEGISTIGIEAQALAVPGLTVSGPASALQVDITNTSKLLVDTASGAVQIKGFTGAKDGQLLHIVKLNSAGNLELLHNDATAVQSLWLKGSSSFQLNGSFGGIILSFDNDQWREVSRS